MPHDQLAHDRINKMEQTILEHTSKLNNFEGTMQRQTIAIEENTIITKNTQTIARNTDANTAELVQLFKGVKSLRQLMLFYSPFAALLAGIAAGLLWLSHNLQRLFS